jgi:TolB protein
MINKTQDPGNLTFPFPSKDGAKLLYVTSSSGNGDVKMWERSTGKVDHLTKTEGTESFPSFSADGKKVLFTRKANNTEDVFELDLATRVEKNVAGGNGDQSRPVYAANNRIVYFTSERGEGMWDLASVDLATGTKTTLAKDARLPTRSRPGVSPDGQWVGWGSNDPTKNTVINLTKVDGSKTVSITTGFTACGEPAITFQKNAAGQMRTLLAYTYLPSAGADWRSLMVVDVTDKLQ